jgi:penicillin-binding protein 2
VRTHRVVHPAVALAVPTLANSAKGDDGTFDDPIVRAAAVSALGPYNGSVVALDPNNGRILSIVNQKLAFSSGFIPCSTIKPVISIAALEEGVVTRDTMISVAPHRYLNLVEALAHSNNAFFEELGRRMGFETVQHYARLLGLGELAGYNLPEENPGAVPTEPPFGGVARMSSFGQGIQMTPLQLASLASTVANGGTIYYLQYPHSQAEIQNFAPRVKRRLDIEGLLPDVRDGMLAAVMYGTARRSYEGEDGEQLLGKTGTCSDNLSHVGWFVSYANQVHPKIVVAVLMRGHSVMDTGPRAAEIAGRMYHRLNASNYFSDSGNKVAEVLPREVDSGTAR